MPEHMDGAMAHSSVECCSFVGPFHKATKLQRQTAKSEATAPNGQYKATAPNRQSTKLQRQTGSPQSHKVQWALHCITKLQRQTDRTKLQRQTSNHKATELQH